MNTLVVMEIFYLFSVRYTHGSALTWRAVLGTRALLIGIMTVTLAQFALTYAPPLQAVFETRPVAIRDGLLIVAAGIAMLLVVEAEKWLSRNF
ncbi:MAG: cation transporting ATPase C-terminal domain-containing protein [Xanthomonadales bacterium]|nr:cation transporting ATPase C-terminal domain-containing protein [Xanthomonadales bacterium]